MDNPAKPGDLTNRDYTVTSNVVAQTRLDEAWRALRRERSLAPLEARITSGDLDVADVVDVVCAAALRVLRNPEGVEEESGSIDDYRESQKRADATQDMYFTAAELRRLAPDLPVPTAGSFKYI